MGKEMSAKASKTHRRVEDLHAIVCWLEHLPNFTKCFDTTGKTSIGKQSSKSEGFKGMVAALASTSNGKCRLKPNQMRDRFAIYKNRYLRSKEHENTTGTGVTVEGKSYGIFTLTQKSDWGVHWGKRRGYITD
ncbi:hypothetical protein L917_10546 [Phytophthora nicotianae]|uniref:Uncharacterized protein n=1 Tax=Phytophthora nicotianae TaxID=4792 RepID=W2L0B4_PHYNI|nr:hypothetical protein L917_10546 [Phytophthora nicotianae]